MSQKEIAESAYAPMNELFPGVSFFKDVVILSEDEVQDFLETIVAEGIEPVSQDFGQFSGNFGSDQYVYEGHRYTVDHNIDEGYLSIEKRRL